MLTIKKEWERALAKPLSVSLQLLPIPKCKGSKNCLINQKKGIKIMFPNAFNPYWWMPQMGFGFGQPFGFGGGNQQGRGLVPPILNTRGVQLADATVDFGIDPRQYWSLPCQSVVILRINSEVPEGGEALPVTIVVPSAGRSTLDASTSTAGAGTATGTTKVPIVDSQNNQLVGDDIEISTERLAFIDKCRGIIRFLEFTSGTDTEAAGA